MGEVLLFAAKAGADPAKVRQALVGGFASSRILELRGERTVERTFAPGFRIEPHRKDLSQALQEARALGVGPLGHGPGARDHGRARSRRR